MRAEKVEEDYGFLFFDGHGNPMNWATHPPNDKGNMDRWFRCKRYAQIKQ